MSPSLQVLLACTVFVAGIGILALLRLRGASRSGLRSGRSPHTTDEFDALRPEVARAVRVIFATQPIYTDPRETVEDGLFTITVRPNKWVLGTEMTVKLRPSGARTTVAVRVESQWFVRDDALYAHSEYLFEFMAALRTELENAPVLSRMEQQAA